MAEIRVIHGDMLQELPKLDRVHSIVTDPPYHLTSIVKRFGESDAAPAQVGKTGAYARASTGFMGKQWDGGDVAFRPETWRLCFDLLPPGGHLLAFAGTRGYHRMACAIEDAGFEMRDTIAWLYGSGFPKSHNLKDEWSGWGTALKPAMELICVARKPLSGTVAQTVLAHGTGALNIDATRIPGAEGDIAGWHETPKTNGQTSAGLLAVLNDSTSAKNASGRWPANVCHDGSDEVVKAFPESNGQSGAVTGQEPSTDNRFILSGLGGNHAPREPRGDSGSAARFFYSSKADSDDRLGSKHPTVKPVDLMRWLVRLVTPPGGTVLDPFAGSGTTGMACMAEGFDCVLVEREAEYVADIKARIAHVRGDDAPLFAWAAE